MNQPALIPRPRNDYSADFEAAWEAYPRRPGNPKVAAYKAYQQRLKEGHSPESILAGVERYAAYCKASGSEGSAFVMMARTFFGPCQYFCEEWEAPEVEPEWAKVPKDDNELLRWAQEHGFPRPRPGESFWDYRKRMQKCVDERRGAK